VFCAGEMSQHTPNDEPGTVGETAKKRPRPSSPDSDALGDQAGHDSKVRIEEKQDGEIVATSSSGEKVSHFAITFSHRPQIQLKNGIRS
jgi:hypothetical protein